jgi:alkylation response protein AidB-like acyl-CoA dehydrogenase
MHLDLSEDRRSLSEGVRRALALFAGTAATSGNRTGDVLSRFDDIKKTIVGIGIPGILVPKSLGGLGLGMRDAVAVAIEAGRAALPFPIIECIAAMAAAKNHPDVTGAVLTGKAVATAPIHGEFSIKDDGRCALAGALSVPFARQSKYLVAPVQVDGFLVQSVLVELEAVPARRTDGLDISYPLADIIFGPKGPNNKLIEFRVDNALGMLAAAEMLGAAEHCLDSTLAYLKERNAMGYRQSLSHIAANCEVGLRAMRASVEYAARVHDNAVERSGHGSEAEVAFRTAKAYCSETASHIAKQCIQLLGEVALTWEYGLHIHFHRIFRLAQSHGTAFRHREVLATLAFEKSENYGGLLP